jgi:hypothetical protein
MAATRIPASLFTLHINTGTTASPIWTEVGGITQLDASQTATTVDGSTFDSDGWADDVTVRRAAMITLTGRALFDETTGAKDPGQAAIETLGALLGDDAKGAFKVSLPGGATYGFTATVGNVTPFGGGKDDLANFSAELRIQGAPVVAAAPTPAPPAPPAPEPED